MMNKYELVIRNTNVFMSEKSQSLDDELNKIQLQEGKIEEIVTGRTKKVVRDKLLGIFKIGELVSTLINWNEDINNEIREAKKEGLLLEYFNKCNQNEKNVTELKNFLSNPQGNTLFNKILRILDDTPPDISLMNHLAETLKFIINSDFVNMFEEHKYALALIEQLTPQALTILADYHSWPEFPLTTSTSVSGKITSDWLNAFIGPYVRNKGISEHSLIERVRNSMNELISKRFVEAISLANNRAKAEMTNMGKLLLRYVSTTK